MDNIDESKLSMGWNRKNVAF